MENKRSWEKGDEEELPADLITHPCLPYTYIYIYMKSKPRHVELGHPEGTATIHTFEKSCWNFYSWSSSWRQFGDLKISGTSLSSLQMTLYMAFFQEGSTSLPAIMALKNSCNVLLEFSVCIWQSLLRENKLWITKNISSLNYPFPHFMHLPYLYK